MKTDAQKLKISDGNNTANNQKCRRRAYKLREKVLPSMGSTNLKDVSGP